MTRRELTAEEATALIDPRLVSDLPVGIVSDLFKVAISEPHGRQHSLDPSQLALIRKHRVLPLIPADWTDSDEVASERIRVAGLRLSLERSWRQLDETLGPLRHDVRVLKGMATSRLDYDSPGLRHTGDIDLLVPPHLLEQVVERLVARGYLYPASLDTRRIPMEKGFPLIDQYGIEVDLHTRLLWKRSTGNPILFERPAPVPSIDALAMPSELRLLHAAIHLMATAPGTRRLSGCIDIAVLMSAAEDLEATRRAAEVLGMSGLCGAGLQVVAASTGVDRHDEELALWPTPSRLEHAAFVRAQRIGIVDQFVRIKDIPGVFTKARFAALVLIPIDEMLDEHGGWKSHLARFYRG